MPKTFRDRGAYDYEPDEWDELVDTFANPGMSSALRRAHKGNPRNLPCPSCGARNVLTPEDRARGYQCDACADRDERGGY